MTKTDGKKFFISTDPPGNKKATGKIPVAFLKKYPYPITGKIRSSKVILSLY